MSNFKADLEFGRYYELEFLKNIEFDTFEQAPDTYKFSDYDLKVTKDDITTTYEIKTDRRAFKSNNICVEYLNKNGEKSGLSLSKANFWVFMIINPNTGYTIYKIPRKELKKMVNNQEFDRQIKVYEGPYCVLFNIDKFKNYLYKVIE